ncbi:MAG: ABC transporter permease [Symploca sp. SIO3C6]|nr:ABC transporter permease [Symploca sp. SIO3C6]NET06565.1 ABC transporter permease [Symploca sp. SIO2B6]
MLQLLTKIDYLWRETLLGIQRGGTMNWAAVSTVTVLLFLFGLSLQISWQLEGMLSQLGNRLQVSVYLEPGAQLEMVMPAVKKLPQVSEIKTISKQEAWVSLVEELELSNLEAATQQLEGNPLVDELKVKVKKPQNVPIIAQQLSQIEGIDEVIYLDEELQSLQEINRGLVWVSFSIIALLGMTSLAVITITIRLIAIARRREIEIMQLVGATSAWIYLPFILQGMSFGVVGATIAWLLIVSIEHFLVNLLATGPDLLKFIATVLQPQPLQLLIMPLLLMSLGGLVGLMGSFLAVHQETLKLGKNL